MHSVAHLGVEAGLCMYGICVRLPCCTCTCRHTPMHTYIRVRNTIGDHSREGTTKPSNEQSLALYALFKQVCRHAHQCWHRHVPCTRYAVQNHSCLRVCSAYASHRRDAACTRLPGRTVPSHPPSSMTRPAERRDRNTEHHHHATLT